MDELPQGRVRLIHHRGHEVLPHPEAEPNPAGLCRGTPAIDPEAGDPSGSLQVAACGTGPLPKKEAGMGSGVAVATRRESSRTGAERHHEAVMGCNTM